MRLPSDFQLRSVVRSHGWSTLGPFDADRTGDVLTIRLPEGPVTVRQQQNELVVRGTRRLGVIRSCLMVDLDLSEFWARAKQDPDLAWAARLRAGRMLRAPTAFADAAMLLATTNCSWALTCRMVSAVIDRWGQNGAFPSQERLAGVSPDDFRTAGWGYRAPYLAKLARGPALEELRNDPRPTEELRRELLRLPGFGPYATESMLKLLGRFEHLALDSWVTRVWKERFPRRKATEPAIRRHLARYGRWQGLAFFLIVTAPWYRAKDWNISSNDAHE